MNSVRRVDTTRQQPLQSVRCKIAGALGRSLARFCVRSTVAKPCSQLVDVELVAFLLRRHSGASVAVRISEGGIHRVRVVKCLCCCLQSSTTRFVSNS